MILEVNKHRIKVQYDKYVHPRKFSEGDFVLLWDQAKEPLGSSKFNPIVTERNQEQINHIKPIVSPKGQLLGTPQWSRQFCYGEKFLWLGVPQQTS